MVKVRHVFYCTALVLIFWAHLKVNINQNISKYVQFILQGSGECKVHSLRSWPCVTSLYCWSASIGSNSSDDYELRDDELLKLGRGHDFTPTPLVFHHISWCRVTAAWRTHWFKILIPPLAPPPTLPRPVDYRLLTPTAHVPLLQGPNPSGFNLHNPHTADHFWVLSVKESISDKVVWPKNIWLTFSFWHKGKGKRPSKKVKDCQ